MTKHTPGPWVFNETIPRMVSSKEGYITRDICRMDSSTMQAFDQDANARLIAAAPELLEALKGLDEAYCRAGSPLTREERTKDRKRLIAARKAIAKATGEAE